MLMHKDRRRQGQTEEQWRQQQQESWRWDSHLWDGVGCHCQWCGWMPPEGIPMNQIPLCMKNPAIIKLVEKISTDIEQIIDKLRGGESYGK